MINLLRLLLLKLAVHKKRPPLSRTQDSIATPLGHVPGPYKRSFMVKSQVWTPSVSARNAHWPDEREADE